VQPFESAGELQNLTIAVTDATLPGETKSETAQDSPDLG
jgi:hypothetical protein